MAALLAASCATPVDYRKAPYRPPSQKAQIDYTMPAEFSSVPTNHPRIFISGQPGPFSLSVPELRANLPTELRIPPEASTNHDVAILALNYVLTGKDEYARAATEALKVRGDMHYQKLDEWVPQYAVAYDWIYNWPGITEDDHVTIEGNLIVAARACQYLTVGSGRQIFHNSYAQMLGIPGLVGLTLFEKPEGKKMLMLALSQYRKEWIGGMDFQNGAINEGASYAREYYITMFPFLAAYAGATGVNLFIENEHSGKGLSSMLDWLDSIERPDGSYSREGDIVSGIGAYETDPEKRVNLYDWRAVNLREKAVAFDFGLAYLRLPRFAVPRDRIFARQGQAAYGEENLAYSVVCRALLKRTPLPSPAQPPAEPPTARLFGRNAMNFVVMCSGVAPDSTHITFHCSDHFGFHQHFDQNHFAIFAGGVPLAIDNGYYASLGTPFCTNYWKSAWAHNTVAVRRENADTNSWFGSQRCLELHTCYSVDDYKKNRRRFDTSELLGFRADTNWAWVSADASLAYDRDVLEQFVRQMIYLKTENTLLVYDETDTARSSDRPVFLLQCPTEPVIEGDTVTVVNGKMKLLIQPLLPKASELRIAKVYGPDANGVQYWEGAKKEPFDRIGGWRVEISGKSGGPTRFLVALAWRPVSSAERSKRAMRLIKRWREVGVEMQGYEVLFNTDSRKEPVVRSR